MKEDYQPYISIPEHLDIREGEMLVIAADLTRIALSAIRHEGNFDPGMLIESYQRKVSENGTLLIPSYNFNLEDKGSFDIRNTRPITGALAETALKRNDFYRTRNPLHSFLVWGRHAIELASLENNSSFGHDSPFGFLADHHARMLFVDTSVAEAFTFVHFAEESSRVHYRRYRKLRIYYTDEQGKQTKRDYTIFAKKPGWTLHLNGLESLLESRGLIQRMTINGSEFSIVDLGAAFPMIMEDLRDNGTVNIAAFSFSRYIKDLVKPWLSATGLYRTTTQKITDGTGLL